MRVVVDTNIVVSSMINPKGSPAIVMNLVFKSRITPLYDNRVIEEYRNVLCRSKFGFNQDQIEPVLDYFESVGEYIVAEPLREHLPDRDDEKFYEILLSGVGKYLITGNRKHFPEEASIVSPGDFLEIYRA